MLSDLTIRHVAPPEAARQPARGAGPDRPAGAVPPAASADVGPANPRLRIDRDLGMVVIEFRDVAGRISMSLPSPREIEAYRAAVVYGADLPDDVRGLNRAPDAPMAARPSLPTPEPAPPAAPKAEAGSAEGLDRVA